MEKKISVLTAIFNKREDWLRLAVESVLNQTYSNFEWIIINDGATDNSIEIIESYKDPRIKISHNDKNMGHSFSLNRGFYLCEGEYILRMDSDDICVPERFSEQIKFMDAHPEIVLAGSWVNLIGEASGIWKAPSDMNLIKTKFLFNNCVPHPSVIIRKKEFLDAKHLFNEEIRYVEDYDLWSRAIEKINITNIPKVLLNYRIERISRSQNAIDTAHSWVYKIRANQLKKLGIELNQTECENLHYASSELKNLADTQIVKSIFESILDANKKAKIYNQEILESVIGNLWLQLIVKKPSAFFGSFRLLVYGFKSVLKKEQ